MYLICIGAEYDHLRVAGAAQCWHIRSKARLIAHPCGRLCRRANGCEDSQWRMGLFEPVDTVERGQSCVQCTEPENDQKCDKAPPSPRCDMSRLLCFPIKLVPEWNSNDGNRLGNEFWKMRMKFWMDALATSNKLFFISQWGQTPVQIDWRAQSSVGLSLSNAVHANHPACLCDLFVSLLICDIISPYSNALQCMSKWRHVVHNV